MGDFAPFNGTAVFGYAHRSRCDKPIKSSYHGWNEAFTISNGIVEAIAVPAVGRVMPVSVLHAKDGPFWENTRLQGKAPNSQSSEWQNLGGDKSWPAPQSDWEKITGRGWPPPTAFDSLTNREEIAGEMLVLWSPVDEHFGVEVERRNLLHAREPQMEIETIYHKRKGDPVRVAVWTITQFKHPEIVVMPLPSPSIFPEGYNKQSKDLPLDPRVSNGWITCRRSASLNTKIGSDASQLIWVGLQEICEVTAPREEGEFPDQSSSAEIYTSADPLDYVELELLGPLKNLKQGEKISRKQIYRSTGALPGPFRNSCAKSSAK